MVIQTLDMSRAPEIVHKWVAAIELAGFVAIEAQQDGHNNIWLLSANDSEVVSELLCDRGIWSIRMGFGAEEMFDVGLWRTALTGDVLQPNSTTLEEEVEYFLTNWGSILGARSDKKALQRLASAKMQRRERWLAQEGAPSPRGRSMR